MSAQHGHQEKNLIYLQNSNNYQIENFWSARTSLKNEVHIRLYPDKKKFGMVRVCRKE